MRNDLYTYKTHIHSVYDGDGTYKATLELGLNMSVNKHLRLYGVDCPEIRGLNKKAGIKVRDFVRSLILDKTVLITTEKDKTGKYGRLLCSIQLPNDDLGALLIRKGYAKPYFGDKKEPFTHDELLHIIEN